MADREFTGPRSLLSALSGRTRTSSKKETGTSSSKAPHTSSKSSTATKSSRRHRFDDKSGPPPPRGSLTPEKLSYLDWRLKRINHVRQKSENSSLCWYDGRDTIGRNSIDVSSSSRIDVVVQERIVPAPAPTSKPKRRVPSSMAYYADEKAAGLEALEHAYSDSVFANLPRLSKGDSCSGSDMSGSSDQHAAHLPPVVLHAVSDKDVGGQYFAKPKKSLFARAGFNKKKTVEDTEASMRNSGPIARIWGR
ncbi:hypothetical protein PSEUBRA_002300 [Kalmanozyma brasiliensis GHG001]|uniref:Uncharacterized protein n=1 Tax=Kalmanozyma brasiliensis (strain GHG001) TaxID=1365824 RepID=V5ECP3_KALBG|nr:uncharacterized protein PSEUBRA_002300 [Kalmanozyma brasiliensis GHG001]EST08211.1 hypothetical protein PSEUBRA_002300 [Kalmanozyma brasiliensis GHG001]